VLGSSARKLVIAIDAGHGGKDPGAIGPSGMKEKDITLRIAKELASAINKDPGMKAVLIRDDDVFVPLQERYMRARRQQADLFVSVHADAALNNAANGSSVFVLSTKGASSQAARWLADKENAADLVGGISLDNKDKNLSAVLLDLSQSATMRMSEDAAGNVLKSLKDLGKTHKHNVEHANFVVLRSPDVPSMLIETGFITNPDEERKLSDPEHRRRLAFAIVQGVREFFIEQPLPGTYYARKQSGQGAGINAAGGIIP
jgi:N-acetylmuramoyl-L-alanine amidase